MSRETAGTVVITGGTKGLGASISRAFYERGFCVLAGGRSENALARKLGPRARFIKMDVRKETDHIAAAHMALEWTSRLDVFVNCAGLSEWRPISEVDDAFWTRIIDTNLKGTMWGTKVAAGVLCPGGCIINVSSLAGKRGSLNNSVYCAAKFGVNGITQAAAKELGPRGIRVNAVCPVYVATPGLRKALRDIRSPAAGRDIPTYLREFAKANAALGRLPKSKEVASLCLFLASPWASAITGQCINVDCGVLPQ